MLVLVLTRLLKRLSPLTKSWTLVKHAYMDQPKKSPNNQKEKSISFIFMNQIWCFLVLQHSSNHQTLRTWPLVSTITNSLTVLLWYNNYYFHYTIILRHSIPFKSTELVFRRVPKVQRITKLGMSHYHTGIKTKWKDTTSAIRKLIWNKQRAVTSKSLKFLQLRQKASLSHKHSEAFFSNLLKSDPLMKHATTTVCYWVIQYVA